MRIVLIVAGVAAVAAAAFLLFGTLPAGFPDGAITPYDRATTPWSTALRFALLLMGIFTLAAAAFGKLRRGAAGAAVALLGGGALFILDACPGLPWCAPVAVQVAGTADDGFGG